MALPLQQTNDVNKIVIQYEAVHDNTAQGVQPHQTNKLLKNEIKTEHDEKENQANASQGLEQGVNRAIAGSIRAIYAGAAIAAAGWIVESAVAAEVGLAAGAAAATAAAAAGWSAAAVSAAALASATLVTGGTALLAIGAFGVVTALSKRKKKKEKDARTRAYNEKVGLFNETLQKSKELDERIAHLQKRLREEEDKLNSKEFAIERHTFNSRIVAAIGPCGFGKSAFCNRMTGNDAEFDDMVGNADFGVPPPKNIKSHTDKIKKVSKNVHLSEEGGGEQRKQSFRLSVVDTPGAFDSQGRDEDFNELMVQFFKACGGVNMFCIFLKFGCYIDANYQKLIEDYCNFWNPDSEPKFWKHCVVVITNCDFDSPKRRKRIEAALPQQQKTIRQFLAKVSNGLSGAIPVYEFGDENFDMSRKKMVISLADTEGAFATKYTCKKVESEVDRLWSELKDKIGKHCKLSQVLQAKSRELEEFNVND